MRDVGKSSANLVSLLHSIQAIGIEVYIQGEMVCFKPTPPIDILMKISTLTTRQKQQLTELVRLNNKQGDRDNGNFDID